ncbi:stage II sporulation protein M [Virgisporangium ochraceum]
MDLDAYVAEHAGEWRRLDQLSRRRRLSAPVADELVILYQRTATHLSAVRSRSPDPALVARLSRLVLQARSALTGGPGFSLRSVGRFFSVTFPLAVYRAAPWWLGVTAAFATLSGVLMWYVASHPEVPAMLLSEDQIDELVNSSFAGYYTEYQPQNFALQVWTNNAFLAAQCLAGGVLVLPVVYVLAVNALSLGLVGGIMIGNGRADVFFGLVTPHGLLELTAVFIAAGFGLRIGWAWIAPGPLRTRGRALGETAREGMVVALGLVLVLFISGLIEAFVTPAPVPTMVRIAIGVTAFVGFLGYVFGFGVRAAQSGESADVEERDALVPMA